MVREVEFRRFLLGGFDVSEILLGRKKGREETIAARGEGGIGERRGRSKWG